MQNSSGIDRRLTLLPYLYTVHTRGRGLRDNLANAATAWIPAILMLVLMTDLGPGRAILYFLLGYAAFISLYEIGYLANDTLGLRRDVVTRDRLGDVPGQGYILAFIAIRIAVFAAVVTGTGLLWSFAYMMACLALVAMIVAHNTVPKVELKFVSFLQMSALRFFLPVYPGLLAADRGGAAAVVLVTGIFCFSYPRLLTYQESKGRLSLPERRNPGFHFQSMALTLPAVAAIAALSSETAPLAVWAWLCFVGLVAARRA